MYLPTFWKLTTEAYGYKLRHMAGWGFPVCLFRKSLLSNTTNCLPSSTTTLEVIYFYLSNWFTDSCAKYISWMDCCPLFLQLDLLHHYPTKSW